MPHFHRPILALLLIAAAAVPVAEAQNEAWRLAAQQRIAQHRMGTLRVVVKDADGQPVPSAAVGVQMKRHAFGFGTAITNSLLSSSIHPQYRQKVENLTGDGRTFNMAVFGNEMKWPNWESSAAKQAITTRVLWLQSRGIAVRGHNLIWPGAQWLPNDVRQNLGNPDYVKQRAEERIRAILNYRGIKGELVDWDVLNEPVHLTDLRNTFAGTPGYTTGEEIYAEWFKLAAEVDPAARLFINEYNIIAHYASQANTRQRYKQIIQGIIDAGAPLYGIGFQGHFSPSDPTSPENVYRALEEFAVFGKKLSITEYDYAYSSNSSSSCRKADEQAAGAYMRDFLTVVFSHPAVESFLMWGFWDGDHWRCDAAMFRNDWSLKPSGQAFLDLVFDAWWTDETVTTDEHGVAEIDAFLGDYDLAVEIAGNTLSRAFTLGTTDTAEVVLSAASTGVGDGHERDSPLVIAPNTPNPFGGFTTLRYALAAPAEVELHVFDVLGRQVAYVVEGQRGAGWHEVSLDGSDLPSGSYFYRLAAGPEVATGTMLVAR